MMVASDDTKQRTWKSLRLRSADSAAIAAGPTVLHRLADLLGVVRQHRERGWSIQEC